MKKLLCFSFHIFFFLMLKTTPTSPVVRLNPEIKVKYLSKKNTNRSFLLKRDLEVFLASDLLSNLTLGCFDDFCELIFLLIAKNEQAQKILKNCQNKNFSELTNFLKNNAANRIINLIFRSVNGNSPNLQTMPEFLFNNFISHLPKIFSSPSIFDSYQYQQKKASTPTLIEYFIKIYTSTLGFRLITRLIAPFEAVDPNTFDGLLRDIAFPPSPADINGWKSEKKPLFVSLLTIFLSVTKINTLVPQNCSSNNDEKNCRLACCFLFYLFYLDQLRPKSYSLVFKYLEKPVAKFIKKRTNRIYQDESLW